ncbi:MAG TPA: pyrroline-5-carboxylate reductase [Thermoleophilaceae bacterium]|nr:pyrroline-5-carboxylate reductase [Thermoleophilaceae bacterium]
MRIGFIGAGSMASALARGLGEPALVFDPQAGRAEALAAELNGRVAASNAEVAEGCDLVILCHKPANLEEVAEQVGGKARAVASIVAATPVSRLEAAYPDTPVYRFIPNIPVEVGRGVLCYTPGTLAAQGPEEELLNLFGRTGVVIPLEEPLIDPAMAVMSCGPAFLALVVEAMADAGSRHGLEPRQARRLVTETMAGTAAYLDANDLDAASLRRRVATPGGLTEKGLQVLEEAGLRDSFDSAVDLVVKAGR